MSDAYHRLPEATIGHLERLKRRGVRFVAVSPETLAGLGRTARAAPGRTAFAPPPERPAPGRNRPPLSPRPRPRHLARPRAWGCRSRRSVGARALDPRPPTLDPPAGPWLAAAPHRSGRLHPQPGSQGRRFRSIAFPSHALRQMRVPGCRAQNVVFGVGDINAKLMFIGEAPGSDEDEQGEPFVGKAGQLLTRIIQTMGLTRDSVYIANILKCRPDTPGQSSGNRKPTSPGNADLPPLSPPPD